MSTDTINIGNVCKVTWAVTIERTELAKGETKRLAAGLRWGQEGAEKSIELRLSVIRHWPFLRYGMLFGPVIPPRPSPPAPLPVWDPLREDDIKEVVRMEMEKRREEHWVAPGESCRSFDGVVGVDRPHV